MDFQHVEYELSFGTVAQIVPSTLPEIAFAGRSNVGKSSLLNKLFNRKQLARVSQNPGKTATINFYKSKDARFVDLPGYGYAKVSKSERNRWSRLIEGYFAQDRNFALVCSLIDIRHAASELDENMVSFLQESDLPYAIVFTKGDKLSRSKCNAQAAALRKQLGVREGTPWVVISAEKGTGIPELKAIIAEAAGLN